MLNDLSRRAFVTLAGAAGVGAALGTSVAPSACAEEASTASGNKKMKFSAMVTLGDWAIFRGAWGDPGVYYILKRMKDTGFSRVYWRTTDGCGQACYPSKVTNPAQEFIRDPKRFMEQHHVQDFLNQGRPMPDGWIKGSADFSQFDSITSGIHWAKHFGLEFYCWHEHAEDHGAVGQISRIAFEHPEWLTRNRDGKSSPCRFSWGIQPAVEHRIALVREVLEHQPDGLYFDFVKSMCSTPGVGCTPHFDDQGVWYCTYDEPVVEAFKKETGRDPHQIPNGDAEWVRFRSRYMTDFVRQVRQMQQRDFPSVKLGAFGCPTGRLGFATGDKMVACADPLRAYLEDHETWTRDGLIDEFVNAYNDGAVGRDPTKLKAMVADSRSRIHNPCRYRGSQLEVYGLGDEPSLMTAIETIANCDCQEIVLFETTPLESNNTWGVIAKAIKQFG